MFHIVVTDTTVCHMADLPWGHNTNSTAMVIFMKRQTHFMQHSFPVKSTVLANIKKHNQAMQEPFHPNLLCFPQLFFPCLIQLSHEFLRLLAEQQREPLTTIPPENLTIQLTYSQSLQDVIWYRRDPRSLLFSKQAWKKSYKATQIKANTKKQLVSLLLHAILPSNPSARISSFNLATSSFNSRINWTQRSRHTCTVKTIRSGLEETFALGSSLITALHIICLARSAYLCVNTGFSTLTR